VTAGFFDELFFDDPFFDAPCLPRALELFELAVFFELLVADLLDFFELLDADLLDLLPFFAAIASPL
jgi:hypothetical protein